MLAMLLVPSVGLLGLGALVAVLVLMALVGDVFGVVLLAGFVVVAALFVVRAVQRVRRHHPLSNWRFMRPFRAEHPKSSRTTVEARTTPSPAPSVVRPHIPAGAGSDAPAPAPAGSTRGRHAR